MGTDPEPDMDELRGLLVDLEAAIEDVQTYGEEADLPAIERNATRMQGTLETLKQNVPGGLRDE